MLSALESKPLLLEHYINAIKFKFNNKLLHYTYGTQTQNHCNREQHFYSRSDLNSLYNFLNTLVLNKLTPEMVNQKDLKQILTLILEDMKGHPKLQLPITLNN